MNPNELKALLVKTKEVAIRPAHVEVPIDNPRRSRRGGWLGPIYCPTGLIKATVIEDGYQWVEKRPISVCGDQTYDIKRKNGVLVEIDLDNWSESGELRQVKKFTIKGKRVLVAHDDGKAMTPYPHTEVITREGKKYIRMITSRKAIFTSWGEYELEMAKREQARQREQENEDSLRNPQAEIMGISRKELDENYVSSNRRALYLNAEFRQTYLVDAKGKRKTTKDGDWVEGPEVGIISITVDQANKILGMLTPAQKKKLKS